MGAEQRIDPHKVTKPIQLLAAWLVGLILVDVTFLTAAATISRPGWAAGVLVVSAVLNVPAFLFAIFLLQTRFRPEMQEDTYYSKYLESKTGPSKPEPTSEAVDLLRQELTEANHVVTQLISDVQESLRDMASATLDIGSLRDRKPEVQERIETLQSRLSSLQAEVAEHSGKIRWSQKKISVNDALPIFPKIARLLSERRIPIHETFGNAEIRPERLNIAVGWGFDLPHLHELAGALTPLKDAVVSYAEHDEFPGEYDDTALIGAYGVQHGIPIQDATALLQTPGMTIKQFYTVIGMRQHDASSPAA